MKVKKKKPWPLGNNNNFLNLHSWFDSPYYSHPDFTCVYTPPITSTPSSTKVCITAKTVFVYFSDEQKIIIHKWFEYYRIVYNTTVKFLRIYPNEKKLLPNLRKKIINILKPGVISLFEQYNFPAHVRDNAIDDVCKAYKSSLALNKGKFFRIRYKKESCKRQSMLIDAQYFSTKINSFCSRTFGNIDTSESIIGIDSACRITWNQTNNTYYLTIPDKKMHKDFVGREKSIGLDPGVRTFQTCYSDKTIVHIGTNITEKFKKKLYQIDELESINSNRRIQRGINKRRAKMQHQIDDMHRKSINYLCSNYDTIYIGKFSTRSVVSNAKSNLTAMTKRLTYLLSHFKFRQRLEAKCKEYGCKYVEVNEYDTSKRCHQCKERNETLGASKVFNCTNCKISIDRDVNAAINIKQKGEATTP